MKRLFAALCMLFIFAASAPAAVNINAADQYTLESLPGICGAKARAIIAYRDKYGEFKSIDELANVKGIGSSVLAKIKDLIQI